MGSRNSWISGARNDPVSKMRLQMRYLLIRNSQLANVDRRGQALPGYSPAYRHVPGHNERKKARFGQSFRFQEGETVLHLLDLESSKEAFSLAIEEANSSPQL